MRSLALAMVLSAGPAFGQVAVNGPQPVDQAVGDLDPLSTSLRVVEPGLGQFNPQSALRRLPDGTGMPLGLPGLPGMPVYVYEAPGVRAYIQRPEYLTYNPDAGGVTLNAAPAVDGMYRPLVPAGTVYDLTPDHADRTRPNTSDADWVDHRIDTRINRLSPLSVSGRLDSRLNTGAFGNADLGSTHAMNGLSPSAYWRQRLEAERRAMELPIEALLPPKLEQAPTRPKDASIPDSTDR